MSDYLSLNSRASPQPGLRAIGASALAIIGGSFSLFFVILFVIVGISAIVVVHEGAHFFVGRKFGMKCTEFFVGFGPRLSRSSGCPQTADD